MEQSVLSNNLTTWDLNGQRPRHKKIPIGSLKGNTSSWNLTGVLKVSSLTSFISLTLMCTNLESGNLFRCTQKVVTGRNRSQNSGTYKLDLRGVVNVFVKVREESFAHCIKTLTTILRLLFLCPSVFSRPLDSLKNFC